MSAMDTVVEPALARVDHVLGGPARRKVVVALSFVLALDAADKAALGAVAAELQRGLGVTNLQLGVLASVSLAAAGLATVPIGILTDRVTRTRLLAISVALWSATLIVTGAASTFTMLLVSRLALGALGATAGPTLASLVGDYFPTHDRARFYGYVLTGEIVGAGIGFVVAGEMTAALSWRWGFWVLVVPGLALAWFLWRMLPEPDRGGGSRIPEGAERVPHGDENRDDGAGEELTVAQEIARDDDIEPDESLVLDSDPTDMPLPAAVRYVLRVRTNRVLIVASALGWFFFAGVRTFAVIFLRGQYGLGQSAAIGVLALIGLGGLIGVLLGGWLSDLLIRRGHLQGRVLVAFVGYGLTPLLTVPAVLSHDLLISAALFFTGTLTLGAANPPVDAGRLDVMHHRLWGRAEGVRTVARTFAEAAAPIAFGGVSQLLAGGSAAPFAEEGDANGNAVSGSVAGLKWTFLIMCIPLALGALVGLRARETYPEDTATAGRSEELSRG